MVDPRQIETVVRDLKLAEDGAQRKIRCWPRACWATGSRWSGLLPRPATAVGDRRQVPVGLVEAGLAAMAGCSPARTVSTPPDPR